MKATNPTSKPEGGTHTPGPWGYIEGRTLIHIETFADNATPGISICSVPKSKVANAKLIAASPAMFEYMAESARNGDAYCQTILKQYALKWD